MTFRSRREKEEEEEGEAEEEEERLCNVFFGATVTIYENESLLKDVMSS